MHPYHVQFNLFIYTPDEDGKVATYHLTKDTSLAYLPESGSTMIITGIADDPREDDIALGAAMIRGTVWPDLTLVHMYDPVKIMCQMVGSEYLVSDLIPMLLEADWEPEDHECEHCGVSMSHEGFHPSSHKQVAPPEDDTEDMSKKWDEIVGNLGDIELLFGDSIKKPPSDPESEQET